MLIDGLWIAPDEDGMPKLVYLCFDENINENINIKIRVIRTGSESHNSRHAEFTRRSESNCGIDK